MQRCSTNERNNVTHQGKHECSKSVAALPRSIEVLSVFRSDVAHSRLRGKVHAETSCVERSDHHSFGAQQLTHGEKLRERSDAAITAAIERRDCRKLSREQRGDHCCNNAGQSAANCDVATAIRPGFVTPPCHCACVNPFCVKKHPCQRAFKGKTGIATARVNVDTKH